MMSDDYKNEFVRLSDKIERCKHCLDVLMKKRKKVMLKMFDSYRKEQEYVSINTNR